MAVGLTAIVYSISAKMTWLLIVYIVGFSHYFLATYYSKHKIVNTLVSPKQYFPLLVLAMLAYVSYTYSASSILLYFGLHHALSEGYLYQRRSKLSLNNTRIAQIQTASFVVHLSGFILLVRQDRLYDFDALNLPAIILFIVSLSIFVSLIWRCRRQISPAQFGLLAGSEGLLVAALLITLVYPITFLHVVFYHFMFWALMPFLRLSTGFQVNIKSLVIYIVLTAISLLVIVKISPLYHPTSSRFFKFEDWFYILSYAHISLSFATSSANPRWINSLFNQRPFRV